MSPPSILTMAGPKDMSPDFTAAATAAQADVPEDAVGPTPRSQIRIRISRPVGGSANWTFVPCGKESLAAIRAPKCSTSPRLHPSPKTTAWGFPTETGTASSPRPGPSGDGSGSSTRPSSPTLPDRTNGAPLGNPTLPISTIAS